MSYLSELFLLKYGIWRPPSDSVISSGILGDTDRLGKSTWRRGDSLETSEGACREVGGILQQELQ